MEEYGVGIFETYIPSEIPFYVKRDRILKKYQLVTQYP
jgi:hypothetical protein